MNAFFPLQRSADWIAGDRSRYAFFVVACLLVAAACVLGLRLHPGLDAFLDEQPVITREIFAECAAPACAAPSVVAATPLSVRTAGLTDGTYVVRLRLAGNGRLGLSFLPDDASPEAAAARPDLEFRPAAHATTWDYEKLTTIDEGHGLLFVQLLTDRGDRNREARIERLTIARLQPLYVVFLWSLRLTLGAMILALLVVTARVKAQRPVAVFLGTLILYSLAVIPGLRGNGGDNSWYVPAAMSLLADGDLDLTNSLAGMPALHLDQSVRNQRDQLLPLYPIGIPVLISPLVLWTNAYYSDIGDLDFRALMSTAAIAKVFAALSVALLFALALQLNGGRTGGALLIAATFALASPQLPTHAGGLGSQNVAMALNLGALYWLLRSDGRWAWLAGLLLGLSYASRPTSSLWIVVLSAYVALHLRAQAPRFAATLALVLAGFVCLSLSLYGSFLPPYYQSSRFFTLATLWHGLTATLISPNRGLLTFTPLLLLAFWGMALAWRQRRRQPLYLYLSALFLLHWVLISATRMWWGGHSLGPRLFLDVVPVGFLLLVPVWERLSRLSGRRGQATRLATYALAAAGLITATLCTVSSRPLYWNIDPNNIDLHPQRAWDWQDLQWRR